MTLAASAAGAQNWTGGSASDWFAPGNWSGGLVPAGSADVFIDDAPFLMIDGGVAHARDVFLGNNAGDAAELTILNGGTLNSASAYLGNDCCAAGGVLVAGPGSQWNVSGDLNIGTFGMGLVATSDGGRISVGGGTGTILLGDDTDALGVLVIGGGGFVPEAPGTVGAGEITTGNGTGILAFHHTDESGGYAFNPAITGGTNVEVAAGTTVFTAGNTYTGETAVFGGTLIVKGGMQSPDVVVDGGQLFVTGPAAIWNADQFTVAGGGAVAVNGGAQVDVGTLTMVGEFSDGALTVSGAGTVYSTFSLVTGLNSDARLAVLDGALLNTDSAVLGMNSSSGALVSGTGSTWASTSLVAIGVDGHGVLTVENGGLFDAPAVILGTSSVDGIGEVAVRGGTSRFEADQLVVGGGGSGTLTVSDGATVEAVNGITIAMDSGSSGVVNIGAAEGAAPAGPGSIDAPQITFGDGGGALVFNHTDNSGAYQFMPSITGSGSIKVLSGATIFAADSTFDGTASVTGGALLVNGNFTDATFNVANGGLLGGTGWMREVNVNAGGIFAPGHLSSSFAPVLVDDITFNPGSFFNVAIDNAGGSDWLVVSNSASLNGGTVRLLPHSGLYADGMSYVIASTTGTVSGVFDGAVAPFAFLDPLLTYDPGTITLTLSRNATSFAGIGSTPNQSAVGGGIEPLGPGNPIYDKVLSMTADEARRAFDLLSGEVHASRVASAIWRTQAMRQRIGERLRHAFAASPDLPVLGYADDGGLPPVPGWGMTFWGEGFASRSHNKGDRNAASLSGTGAGGIFGADMGLGENWRAGIAGGYDTDDSRASGRASSTETGNYHLLAYGGGQYGGFGVRLGAEHIWHDVEADRQAIYGGVNETLRASYNARSAQLFGEVGYTVAWETFAVEPYAAAAFVHHEVDAFAETGGLSALNMHGRTTKTGFSTLGLRGSASFALTDTASLILSGGAAWRHAYGDVVPVSLASFSGGVPFEVRGTPIVRDALALETGVSVDVSGAVTLGVGYSGQVGRRMHEHGAKGNIAIRF